MTIFGPYQYWNMALAGHKPGGPTLPIHDGQPQAGFYRRKAGGHFVPVAIYEHDGLVIALVGDVVKDANAEWLRCAEYPVTEADYRHALETGQWPDVDKSIAPPAPGHNLASPTESIASEIETAAESVKDYETIRDDEHASRAQSLRSKLLEIARDADRQREELKRPHLEAGKSVDAAWQPYVKRAKELADTVRASIERFLTEKGKAEAAALAKAEAERRQAEAANMPAPPPPPAPVEQTTQIKGGYGRAAKVKEVLVVTDIKDFPAVCKQFEANPELRAVLIRLAQRSVDAGYQVPGVVVETKRKVA